MEINLRWDWLRDESDGCDGDADGAGVLEQCCGQVASEELCDEGPCVGSAEGACNGADGSCERADEDVTVGEAEGDAAERAGYDAGDELWGDEAAGGLGELVVDDLADGQESEDVGSEGETEEGEPGVVEVEVAEARGPTDDGEAGEGAQAGDGS